MRFIPLKSSLHLLLFTAIPLAGLIVAAGCSQQKALPTPIVARNAVDTANKYAGSDACKECHRAECDAQDGTHHALTLRKASLIEIGKTLPPVGPISGTPYSVERDGNEMRFVGTSPTGKRGSAIQYIFGSGAQNCTYVGSVSRESLTEFHMSWNPGKKVWYITPGQESFEDIAPGFVHPPGAARRCVACHSSDEFPAEVVPPDNTMGVRCEACHGPGLDHIQMHRTKTTGSDPIKKLSSRTPHEVNEACGRCHRSVGDINLTGLDSVNTSRFQPYAIETSACFRKSNGAMSCITCHDPHRNASTDIKHYEQVCLSCHNGGTGQSEGKKCPVNSSSGCIPCHMPQKRLLPGTKIPLALTDHYIWAYRARH